MVGAIVQHAGKVLLLQRPEDDFMGGILELPSGKVEEDETLDAALIREVKEETGLEVAALRHYLGSFDYTSGSDKKSRQLNFAVEVAPPEPVELQEHDDYSWVPLTDDPPVTDAVRAVLGRYRSYKSREVADAAEVIMATKEKDEVSAPIAVLLLFLVFAFAAGGLEGLGGDGGDDKGNQSTPEDPCDGEDRDHVVRTWFTFRGIVRLRCGRPRQPGILAPVP